MHFDNAGDASLPHDHRAGQQTSDYVVIWRAPKSAITVQSGTSGSVGKRPVLMCCESIPHPAKRKNKAGRNEEENDGYLLQYSRFQHAPGKDLSRDGLQVKNITQKKRIRKRIPYMLYLYEVAINVYLYNIEFELPYWWDVSLTGWSFCVFDVFN